VLLQRLLQTRNSSIDGIDLIVHAGSKNGKSVGHVVPEQ
jgi:hypothetical protein